jgi:hypothetical protein
MQLLIKDTIATFATDALTPFINLFNQSRAAAGVLVALLVKLVASRIVPALGDQIAATQAKSVASTQAALAAAAKARRVAVRFEKEQSKTSTDTSLKAIKVRDAAFKKSLGDRIKFHKAFTKQIFNQEQQLQVAVLTEQRAALQREINARAKGKGMQKIFVGTSDADLKRQLNTLNQIGASIEKANISTKKLNVSMKATTTQITTFGIKAKAAMAGFRAETARAVSLYRTGFAQIFLGVNESLFKSIGRVGRAWAKFALDVARFKGATILGSFGRAAGRTAGLIGAAFTKALGALTSILIVVELARFAWEKWGDSIRGITPGQRAVIDATEELTEGLKKSNEILAEGIEKWGDKAPSSLKDFADSLIFISGIFETLTNEISQFTKKLIEGLGGFTVEGAIQELERLKEAQNKLLIEIALAQNSPKSFFKSFTTDAPEAREKLKEIEDQIKNTNRVLNEFGSGDILGPLINQFATASEFAENLGLNLNRVLLDSSKIFDSLKDEIGFANVVQLKFLASRGRWDELKDTVEELKDKLNLSGAALATLNSTLAKFFSTASGEVTSLGRSAATSLKQLQEVGVQFNTYILGIDKLRSQKSPFKELFGFALDAENALNDLVATQEVLASESLDKAFKSGKLKGDLTSVRSLLGEQVTTIKSAQEAAKDLKEEFAKQLQAQLLGTKNLKAAQLELAEVKAREIRSDEERLQQAQDINSQEITLNILRGNLAASNLAAAERALQIKIDTKKVSDEQLDIERLNVAILKQELDAITKTEKRLLRNTAARLEAVKLNKEILNNIKSRFQTAIKIANIDKDLVTSQADYASLTRTIFETQKRSLDIDKKLVQQTIKELEIKGITGELEERELAAANAKLVLLERQTEQLIRQNELIIQARELQATGEDVFTAQGMQVLGGIFSQAVIDNMKKLKPTLQTLGEGFAGNINSTIDAGVDKLLEGHGFNDFADTVLEALKDGLRQTFGDALKNAIKQNIAELFNINTKPPGVIAAEANTMALGENKKSLDTLTKALEECKLGQGTPGAAASGVAAGSTVDTRKLGNVLQGIASITEQGNSNIADKIDTGNESADLAIEVAEQGNSSIISSLIALGTQIVAAIFGSQTAESGGEIFGAVASAFGGAAADGGIAKGGIKSFANGGIVRAPTLGLVGEGRRDEAIVPLPNNREIPVDLKGQQGDTIEITQSFDFSNADPNTVAQLQTQAKLIEERTFTRVFSEINKGGKFAKMVGRRS